MTDESEKTFSPLCLERAKRATVREVASSLAAEWTALFVQTLESSARFEEYIHSPIPDLSLAVVVNGAGAVESFSGGERQKAVMRSGDVCMTAGGRADHHRIKSLTSNAIQTLHIYIPAYHFARVADEYARAGTASRLEQPDALGFTDPVVVQTGFALIQAVEIGAPNLYAESAAQFLATHLLLTHSRRSASAADWRNPGAITDRRLARVLEFIGHHCTENLTLDQIAREAGISRFHFITLFKKACGVTPHQYLLKLRLERAAELINTTDLSIQAIAANCGFVAPSHFSAAFRKHFGQTASEYQRTVSGSTRFDNLVAEKLIEVKKQKA
jgi:AraC family transcriptional regulator